MGRIWTSAHVRHGAVALSRRRRLSTGRRCVDLHDVARPSDQQCCASRNALDHEPSMGGRLQGDNYPRRKAPAADVILFC